MVVSFTSLPTMQAAWMVPSVYTSPWFLLPASTSPRWPSVVAVTTLAYHVAVLKGTDVDQPRNLAKSVTVE